jgi:ADP-ribose pyrophosphatase YjhB (NUDIX family)
VSTFRFCPRCGSQLAIDSAQPFAAQKCFCCGSTHYHGSKPCAGALIVEGNRVLLAERAVEPFKGDWDVPGGFLEAGEDPKEGARREVREETGLEVEVEGPFAVLVDRYPYGTELDYTLNLYYLAHIIAGTPRPADDVASLRWFPLDSPPERIAFAHCRELLERLKQSRQ